MKKTLFFFIIATLTAFKLCAQISSLEKLLNEKDVHDTLKIQEILNYGNKAESTSKDSAVFYYQWALKQIEQCSNNNFNALEQRKLKLQKANALRYSARILHFWGQLDKAVDSYFRALTIYEEIDNKRGMSACFNNLGNYFHSQGSSEAITYYKKALAIDEQLGDKKGVAICYNNIGLAHYNFGVQSKDSAVWAVEYGKAIEYYRKAIAIYSELGEKKDLAKTLNNIGIIYSEKGIVSTNPKVKQNLQSLSSTYFHKSLRIREEIGDKIGVATLLANIAAQYVAESELYPKQQARDSLLIALRYAKKSLKITEELKALQLKSFALKTTMYCYSALGDYKNAFTHAVGYITTKDSILNTEKAKIIAELQTKYETEKQQQEIEKQKITIEKNEIDYKRQKSQLQLFIVGSLLLGLVILFVLRGYWQKKRSNRVISEKNNLLNQANNQLMLTMQTLKNKNDELKNQNIEINRQHNEIELQNLKLELLTENLQTKSTEIELQKDKLYLINKEITDSIIYAQRIQRALIPSQQALTEMLPNHFVLFKPKSIVSGDFYWAARVKKWTIFCVADCTGHGVPGALMSMLGVSFLNEIVRKDLVTNAADILNRIRALIISSLKDECTSQIQIDGIEMALCVLDNNTLKFQFAGANLPCWVVPASNSGSNRFDKIQKSDKVEIHAMPNSKTLIEFQPNRMPLSLYQRMSPFEATNFQLYQGDTVYLLSDGFQDQFGGTEGKKYQTRQLKETIANISSFDIATQHQMLIDIFENWKKDKIQLDDVTVMGVMIN